MTNCFSLATVCLLNEYNSSYANFFVVTVCVRLCLCYECDPDHGCVIVSPLDKPRCFYGKQWLIIWLNKPKLTSNLKVKISNPKIWRQLATGFSVLKVRLRDSIFIHLLGFFHKWVVPKNSSWFSPVLLFSASTQFSSVYGIIYNDSKSDVSEKEDK